jgi:hypothetical protein
LYGHAKLDEKRTLVEIIETKINDLLQYINNAMDMTRMVSIDRIKLHITVSKPVTETMGETVTNWSKLDA